MLEVPKLGVVIEVLKSLRIPQRTLAKRAGVSQATIAKMMRGKQVRYETVYKLAQTVNSAIRGAKSPAQVGSICHRPIEWAQVDEPVNRPLRIMLKHSYDQLPVKDALGRVVGSLRQRNLGAAVNALPNDPQLQTVYVAKVMDRPFPTVDESETVGVVRWLLLYQPAVLVQSKGVPVGIVTWADTFDVSSTTKAARSPADSRKPDRATLETLVSSLPLFSPSQEAPLPDIPSISASDTHFNRLEGMPQSDSALPDFLATGLQASARKLRARRKRRHR